MSKTLIAPLLAFIYLTLELFFHIKIDEQLKMQINDWLTNGFALAFILYGIFKSHQKKKETK